MKRQHKILATIAAGALLGSCAGVPVAVGTRATGTVPSGPARTITAEACGFQLLLLIPIAINNRMERAYKALEAQAAGDYITDVQVNETWGWRFVGTSYCTTLQAKAIGKSA